MTLGAPVQYVREPAFIEVLGAREQDRKSVV